MRRFKVTIEEVGGPKHYHIRAYGAHIYNSNILNLSDAIIHDLTASFEKCCVELKKDLDIKSNMWNSLKRLDMV